MTNGFYDRLLGDCSGNGFVALAQARYNALRTTILNREYIMELVREQYDVLAENGAYEREHQAWPDFTVDESQLDYMSDWLDARFAYLDVEINSACGTWNSEENTATNGVEVFPNPAKGRINIRFAEAEESVISLYDMTGRMVYSTRGASQVLTIPTHGFRSGIYTVLIQQKDHQFTERVIIQ